MWGFQQGWPIFGSINMPDQSSPALLWEVSQPFVLEVGAMLTQREGDDQINVSESTDESLWFCVSVHTFDGVSR